MGEFGGINPCLSSIKSAQADSRAFVASVSAKRFHVLSRWLQPREIREQGVAEVGVESRPRVPRRSRGLSELSPSFHFGDASRGED